jgi:hypothetical protein
MQLVPLHCGGKTPRRMQELEDVVEALKKVVERWGFTSCGIQLPHSLSSHGFNPGTWNVISWFQAFAFTNSNLCRYIAAAKRARRGAGAGGCGSER